MNKRFVPLSLVLLLVSLLGAAPRLHAQDDAMSDTLQLDTVVVEEGLLSNSEDDEEETTTYTVETEDEDAKFRPGTLAATDSGAVQARRVPDDRVRALRADDAFWYLGVRPKQPKQEAPRSSRTSSPGFFSDRWISYILWTLVGIGILAAIIAFLSAVDASPFRRRKEVLDADSEPSEEDLFSFDFDAAIRDAAAAENYRLAIRLMYLQLLRVMAERNVLQYRQERTNSAYVSQLYGTPYHADFLRATRYYEYAWYGQLPVSATAYAAVRTQIDHLKNRVA
ncbi:DUF4129 domain-containing protein [Flaviaesturariibacter amylovorans]|uniref:Protein-glutamine gamma-glutamyltransferase-like C-terminal domain-containing protein n=1 Tax=Flaviaesturariibacter amylovorans TaxID=1084520 RepID=A0ABP8GZ39_9BACT